METIVQQLAEGLPAQDSTIKTEVLCCQPRGQGVVETINGVTVTKASSWGRFLKMPVSVSFFKHFKKLSKEADIIDLHHPFPLSFLAYRIYKPKGKLVVHYHADIFKQRRSAWLIRPLLRYVLKQANTIVVSNPNLIKSSPLLSSYQEKCLVTPFGIDYQKLASAINAATIAELQRRYGTYVLYVGRLSYYKGIDYLLRAMKDLPYNVVIVGEGDERKRLDETVKQLGIERRVFFLPPQPYERLANFYAAAQVFVLPSVARSEAYGLVILEAMACGTPVISTELHTGTSFVNKQGVTGLVVPPKNAAELRDAIQLIVSNAAKRDYFGKNAQKYVSEALSLEKMLQSHLQMYYEHTH